MLISNTMCCSCKKWFLFSILRLKSLASQLFSSVMQVRYCFHIHSECRLMEEVRKKKCPEPLRGETCLTAPNGFRRSLRASLRDASLFPFSHNGSGTLFCCTKIPHQLQIIHQIAGICFKDMGCWRSPLYNLCDKHCVKGHFCDRYDSADSFVIHKKEYFSKQRFEDESWSLRKLHSQFQLPNPPTVVSLKHD